MCRRLSLQVGVSGEGFITSTPALVYTGVYRVKVGLGVASRQEELLVCQRLSLSAQISSQRPLGFWGLTVELGV